MSIFRRKKQTDAETESLKSFLDMIAPSIVKFETGYYICGNTFRCIWALREYPTSTDDLAILRHLGEKHGVTLHIYTRMVSPLEERKIVHNAEIRNRMNRGSSQDLQRSVEAESNLQDVANLIGSLHRNKEPLLHCAVYIEMIAGDMQELQILQTNVEVELMRSKLNVDRLKLRQQAGFCAVSPVGFNAFGTEYERVLPASSVMAKAIGMTVIAFDIFHIPGIEEQLGIPYVEMDELLAKSDFISVHAPAVDGGALINAERIAKMKDGVCIINTSRGTNVDEAALLAALESGKVRAAGLDVYADEPASNSALYSHPMVSCTPHIGAATVEAQKRIGAEIVDIITNFGK